MISEIARSIQWKLSSQFSRFKIVLKRQRPLKRLESGDRLRREPSESHFIEHIRKHCIGKLRSHREEALHTRVLLPKNLSQTDGVLD